MALFRRADKPSDGAELGAPNVAAPMPVAPAASAPPAPEDTDKDTELEELRSTVLDMQRVLNEIADQGTAQNRVFDLLHTELQDYKNDFIYEHLKPVLWPLLFLFDSLEQYAREVVGRVSASGEQVVEAREVLDHLKFFRGQLVEALRICEVTPMKQPSGVIDVKSHKGIGIEKVDNPAEDNTVRRVVRTGWYLNGKVLRHAEVIVGKYNEPGPPPQVVPLSGGGAEASAASPPKPSAKAGNLSRAAETLRSSEAAGGAGGGRGV
jgi:molecular chaperone GrpE (heat shock protein)